MSGSGPTSVEIAAPAKLNLGLEVLGRRDDGYHEIATIFLAIDLQDRLLVSPDDQLVLESTPDGLAGAENLALQALEVLRESSGVGAGASIELTKRIPIASGLGGASSDAAAALFAGREAWRLDVSDASLHRLAAKLGSDVPFFLHGGCALGRGRGETLEALPVPVDLWFVIAVPDIALPRKTATLYAALDADDFSDGARVLAQARRIAAGLPIDVGLLGNAFARPLYALAPHLADLPSVMRDAGAEAVALSGAGPAHFAPFPAGDAAEAAAGRLRRALGAAARVFVARPLAERPAPSRPL